MNESGKNRLYFDDEPSRDDESVWRTVEEESPDGEPVYLDEPVTYPSPRSAKRRRGVYRYYIWGGLSLFLLLLAGGGAFLYYRGYFKREGTETLLDRKLGSLNLEGMRDRFYVPEEKVGPALAHAIDLYRQNDRDAAKRALENFVNGAGEDSEKSIALVYLGLMAMDTERYALAKHELLRALRYNNDSVAALVNLAIVARKLGDLQEARSYGERARSLAPNDSRVSILLGNLLAEGQDLSGAIETYREGIKNTPEDPLLYYNLALSLLRKGQNEEAILYFSKAIEVAGPGQVAVQSHGWLGQIYFNQGNLEMAADQLEKAVQLAPDSSRYLYNLGVIYLRMHKGDRALETFQKALTAGQSEGPVYRGLARAFREMKRDDLAIQALQKALLLNPEDLDSLFLLGDLYYNTNDLLQAADSYRRIVNQTPGDENTREALLKLGSVYLSLERYTDAAAMYERVLSLQSNNSDALYGLGVAYDKMGRTDQAVAVWKQALQEGSGVDGEAGRTPLDRGDEKTMRLALARIYRREGAFDLAIQQLRLTQALDKRSPAIEDDPDLSLEMAETYSRMKDSEHAIQYFKEASKSPSLSAEKRKQVYRDLATVYAGMDRPEDLDSAKGYANRAARMDPDDPSVSLLQASLLMKSGSMTDRERAIEILRAITASDVDAKTSSKAYNLLGLAYYKNGEFSRAVRAFDYSVQLDPSNREAYDNQRAAVNSYEQSLKESR